MRPVNPYIVGNPVKDKTGFFGRQDIFRDVMRVLRQRESNAIVLYGQRRIGKTSVLLQLEKQLAAEGEFTPVYFDLQDKAAKSLPEVLYELSQHISRVTGHTIANQADFGRTGDYFRGTFLPQIAEKVASGGLVLLFDEFDVLDSPARTQASEAFFPYLRQWMTDLQKVKFVFVIGRRPEDLSVRTMYSFKDIQSTRVSFLTPKDAEQVIRQSERNGSLKWDESAIRRVLELSHAHPYFTQLLCSVVWENANEEIPGAAPVAVARDVDNAIPQALKFGANAFNWLWDGLPPAERVVVAAMAEIKDDVITQEKLIETLNQSGVRLVARELEFAPETLIDWEVLIKADGGYRFAVPLLRRWVLANRPLRRVKDELDRLDPLADTLFQAGQGFYNNNDADTAEQQLRQALNINPNHLKARLLLGRILLEKGRLSESVDVFDVAYQYDGAARADYVKSLLALAESQAQDDGLQLATYQRVLEVQPDQPLANERIRAIWAKRGEAAQAQENFDEAIKAFEQAGQAERVEKIHAMMREKKLAAQMQQAQSYEKSGQWKAALDAYQLLASENPESETLQANIAVARASWRAEGLRQLEVLDAEQNREKLLGLCDNLENDFPDDADVKTCIENARAQLGVTQKYHEALGALQSGQADQARQMFSQVLAINPKHLQAAHKLIESTYGKVNITRPVPAGVWIPVGVTGLLWVLLGTLAAGGLLWSALARWVFDLVRGEDPLGWLAVESLLLAVVLLTALVGISVTLWARWALDLTFRVEARDSRSVWRALVAHLPFGLGLFYANRLAWRRWVYPFLALSLPVVLLVSPLLLATPIDQIKEYNPNFFEYYDVDGTERVGVIERASAEGDAAPWNIALWAAGGVYLLSLVDALVSVAMQRRKVGQSNLALPLATFVAAHAKSTESVAFRKGQTIPPVVVSGSLTALIWVPLYACVAWVANQDRLAELVKYGLPLAILAAWLLPLFLVRAGKLGSKTLWLMFFLFLSITQAVVMVVSVELNAVSLNSILNIIFWIGLGLGLSIFFALPLHKSWWNMHTVSGKTESDMLAVKYSLPAIASAAMVISVSIRLATLDMQASVLYKSNLPLAAGLLGFILWGILSRRWSVLGIGLFILLVPLSSIIVHWEQEYEFPQVLISVDAFLRGTIALLAALALLALGIFKLDLFHFMRAKLGKRKNDTARS